MATLVYLSLSSMAPLTGSWSPTKVVIICVLPHQGRVLSDIIYSNNIDRCFAAAGPKLWNSLPAEVVVSVALLVARQTNNQKVVGLMPANVVCITADR